MSDTYQAVYDAVRSRISNGNVGEAIERVAFQALDIGHTRAVLQEAFYAVALSMDSPHVLMRPALSVDGDKYCALYGSDLVNGVAGFGDTASEAMEDFDKNWFKQKAPTSARASS